MTGTAEENGRGKFVNFIRKAVFCRIKTEGIYGRRAARKPVGSGRSDRLFLLLSEIVAEMMIFDEKNGFFY